ncbi:HAD family hydrolase [Fodinibius sp. AD559]|uniref:HAD family hydrolase n=1 Tax=Fodinibius sp. AD559 TaxID=3424179 RepID=UPI004046E162
MMNIKNIFFDFDGVLAESVHVKTEAFYQLYLPYGEEIAEKVVVHHRANGGVSRFEKFRIYHSRFLDEEIDEEEVQELAEQFSNLVVDGVVEAPEVPGVGKFLEKYHKTMDFWVITGTPTEEIKQIVSRRELDKYFIELCGSPTKKPEWTNYLLEKYELDPDETLFLGDSMSDYKGAKAGGTHFALRSYEENKELFGDYTGLRFYDFKELEKKIDFTQ